MAEFHLASVPGYCVHSYPCNDTELFSQPNSLLSTSAHVAKGVSVHIDNKMETSSYLFADLVECVWAAIGVAELHVNGVVEQSQAAMGLQDSVGLLEKAWSVEPVERRHGCHQVHWAVSQWQLLGHALSKDGTVAKAKSKLLTTGSQAFSLWCSFL